MKALATLYRDAREQKRARRHQQALVRLLEPMDLAQVEQLQQCLYEYRSVRAQKGER